MSLKPLAGKLFIAMTDYIKKKRGEKKMLFIFFFLINRD